MKTFKRNRQGVVETEIGIDPPAEIEIIQETITEIEVGIEETIEIGTEIEVEIAEIVETIQEIEIEIEVEVETGLTLEKEEEINQDQDQVKDTLIEMISAIMLHNLGVCPPLKPGSFQQTRVPNSLPMGVN